MNQAEKPTHWALTEGNIVKASPRHHADGHSDEDSFYLYVLKSIKQDTKTVSYAVLPAYIIPKTEEGRKAELKLLQQHRGNLSDKLPSTPQSGREKRHYRTTFEIGEIPVDGNWILTPIDLIQDIETQKKILNSTFRYGTYNALSVVDGQPLLIDGIATSRSIPRTKATPHYIDIDVRAAVAAGYIPQGVANILSGKISRLSTAAQIAQDTDPDKLLQIYDAARKGQSLSFVDFKAHIIQGISAFFAEVKDDAGIVQAKIPDDAKLKFPGKEKIKFKFVERFPDLALDDAYVDEGADNFILHKATYNVLKAAGFKTLRQAFNTIQKNDIGILRGAFTKANATGFTLVEIVDDLQAALEALDEAMEKPEEFSPREWDIQAYYPAQEIK